MDDETPEKTLYPLEIGRSHPDLKPENLSVLDPAENAKRRFNAEIFQLFTATRALLKTAEIIEGKLSPKVSYPSGFWFEMLVPVTVSADFLANLEEVFVQKWVPKYGHRKAKILWHTQCGRMAVQHWFDKAMATVTAIRKTIW